MSKKSFSIIAGIAILIVGAIFVKHQYGNYNSHGSSQERINEKHVIHWTPSTKSALIKEMHSINQNYQALVPNLSQGNWAEVIENSHNIHSDFILKQELSEDDMATDLTWVGNISDIF